MTVSLLQSLREDSERTQRRTWKSGPGTVAYTYNPSSLGDQGGQITWDQEFETSLTNTVKTKNTKISWVWCCMPVIPATQVAETGESLECKRWRLQWAEVTPVHSSLGNRVRLSEKKKQKTNKKKTWTGMFFSNYTITIGINQERPRHTRTWN